jgi:hypothetical protein
MFQRSTYHSADTDVSLNGMNETRQPKPSKNSGDGPIGNFPTQEGKHTPRDDKTTEVAEISEIPTNNGEPENDGTKVIAEAKDIVTTVLHVEDDVSLNPWTFRMFSIGELGLP